MPLLNGFNRTTKEFFRPNYDLSHLEVYAMKNLNSPVYSVFINEKIFQIELFGPSLYLQTVESLKIYTEGTLTKIIGLDSASYKLQQSFRYPLLFQAQQLYL